MKEILKFMYRKWVKAQCRHLCHRCKYYDTCRKEFTR